MFPLDNFILNLVGRSIENFDMRFVTATFALPYLRNNIVETVYSFKEVATTSQS